MGFDLIEDQDFFPLSRVKGNFIDENDYKNFLSGSSMARTGAFVGQSVPNLPKQSKLLGATQVVSGVADLGIGIVSTIATIKDAQKRAEIQENLQRLSIEKQQELELEIQNAQSINEKLRIITEAVTRIKIAEVQGKLSGKDKSEENKKILYIVGGSFALLVGIVLIKLVSK
jgi:hypothetical protein